MKDFLLLFVLAVALGVPILRVAAQCVPETCPPGPVVVNFENADCTGARTYESIASTSTSPCENDVSGFRINLYDEAGVWMYTQINNPTCDLTRSDVTYSRTGYHYGACVPQTRRDVDELLSFVKLADRRTRMAMGPAIMIIASVNATIVAPQEPQAPGNPKNLPSFDSVLTTIPCDGPLNCSLPDGTTPDIITTDYDELGNCSSAVASAYANGTVGTCYFQGSLYAALQCIDYHGFELVDYLDDSCSRPYTSGGSRVVCEGSSESITCGVAPAIPTTPSPVSSTSTSGPAAVELVSILCFVLLAHF